MKPMQFTCFRMRTVIPTLLFTLTGLATGCVGDELETEQSELVGGTPTTARPEIGQFGGCTATLISPRIVMLAAHCLNPQYTATTATGSFTFTDLNGVPQSYPVDNVHSFATKRWEVIPSGAFTSDLALLHLATAVPSSQAVPAATAVQEPRYGDVSTIFGFGCTNRYTQAGGGGKQFFSYTYGIWSRALCWGDSGGPVVFGNFNGNGAIWGVNSDFDWNFPNWQTGDWIDVFAGVSFYRKQIEDIARAWDGADEQGVDRFGLDYATRVASSAADCRTICEADGNCRAFTWSPTAGGRCWLKSGVPEPTPGPNLVSGLPAKLEVGIDRWGSDYSALNLPSAESCAAACGRDNLCAAWTHRASTCWLKGTVPPGNTTTCPTCTSGVTSRGLEVGIDRPGNDIAVYTAPTVRGCASLCAQDHRCEAYSHTVGAPNNCRLKDSVPSPVVVSIATTSGVRRGLETNTNRAGSDYYSFATNQVSPAMCQAACAQQPQCQAWTYTPPPPFGPNAICSLKNAIPARSTATGMVSGVKSLEMLP